MPEIIAPPATKSNVEIIAKPFGDGRYSKLMESCCEQISVVFPDLSQEQAVKIAKQIGSDFGAAIKHAQVDAKVGKSINKDGKVTLSEAAKVKGVIITDALHVMHALNFAADAGKYGFSWKHTKFAVLADSGLHKAIKNLTK